MKKFELSIPKPCHENWEAMTPEQKGRFCGSCQKTVIDFTDMSDRQIAEFFKKPAGNVCGRFGGDQLNRIIEVPRKRIPWIKYFFTIAVPAFLLAKKAAAQGEVRLKGKVALCTTPAFSKEDTLIKPQSNPNVLPRRISLGRVAPSTVNQAKQDSSLLISGRVTDEQNNALQYASIRLLNTQQGTMTDSLGNFSLRVTQPDGIIQVSFVGFEIQRVSYRNKSFLSVALKEDKRELMGAVIIVPENRKKPVPLMPFKKADTTFSKFSVFPNPVDRNSVFTIETKNLEDGRYNLSIVTSDGQTVQTKELIIEKKARRFPVQLDNIKAAPYFIRLTNKANNKSYTEIILVK